MLIFRIGWVKNMRFLVVLFLLFSGFSHASEYVLGPGDQISITVYNEPDLTTNVKINKTTTNGSIKTEPPLKYL